jgi:hypothetical protein
MTQPFRVFLKTPSLGVKTRLFGWPNFTGFALIEHILRKISMTYERATVPNMKGFFLAILVVVSMGCGSTEQHSANSEPFTGVISANQLIADYPQFRAAYDQYQPNSAEIAAAKSLSGKSLVVLFGTWCHDSEREVPRLLKLLDLSGVKLVSFSLHGVNYNKQEPNDLHRQYALRYSPTIILLEGENDKFRFGESSVFLLNKRQEKYIDGRMKLVDSQIKLQQEFLDYLYYTNALIEE